MIHQEGEASAEGFRPSGRQIVGAIIAILLVIFIIANNDDVVVSLVVTDATLPMWLVLGVTALLGFGVGMMMGARRTRAKIARKR